MPRTARRIVPGVVYHLRARFVDRDWLLREHAEREQYLKLLGRALTTNDWKCISYALMSSHIHLALIAGRDSLWRLLKRVHSPFARWMNKRRGRLGPIFADRPIAEAVPSEHIARLIAYIHNNPVRAKVVTAARDSSWTSHRSYAGLVTPPPWLQIDEGLRRASIATAEKFDEFVDASANDQRDQAALDALKSVLRPRARVELGTRVVGDHVVAPILLRPHSAVRPDLHRIVELAGARLAVPPEVICSRTPNNAAVTARRLVVAIARAYGHIGADIAAALGVSEQTVSRYGLHARTADLEPHARQIVEHLRDELMTRNQ